MTTATRPPIRSRSRQACPLCGGPGTRLYRGLRDRFGPDPEEWAMSRCADPACGLLWLDPVPVEEDIAHAYHEDYYTHRDEIPSLTWYRSAFRWFRQGYLAQRYGYRTESTAVWQRLLGCTLYLMPRRRRDVDASVMHLFFREGGRLLEVGCGGGAILTIMAELGWRAEGVDFDAAAVANARSKGLTVHHGRLEEQGFENGCFHAIVLSHVIEHVADPRRLLEDCRRLLHPEGVLVILTPNAEGLSHRVFGASSFTLEPPRHLWMFNTRNLRRLVESTGLRISSLATRSRGARDYWVLSREIRRTGRVDPARRRTWIERLGGFLFEVTEAVIIGVRPEAGDEIFLQAGGAAGAARVQRTGDEVPSGAR